MSFHDATINHLRAVRNWALAHGGSITLDLVGFELEVKAHHRYFTLYPQFLAEPEGRRVHTVMLTDAVVGFIGWLPYRPLRWALSSDKLLFKRRLTELGLPTPTVWDEPAAATADYVVKASAGSFGLEIAGPFRAGGEPGSAAQHPTQEQLAPLSRAPAPATIYCERFVRGRNVKAWFWGERVFHLELDDYASLTGDGRRSIGQLLAQRLERIGSSLEDYAEMPMVLQSLRYQGLALEDVPVQGRTAWLDFRYGRRFSAGANRIDTNALNRIGKQVRQQLDLAGRLLSEELMRELKAPVLYSLDGVLDAAGRLWWLEINSNPVFAPTGYPCMLATLFGTTVTEAVEPDESGGSEAPDAAPGSEAPVHPATVQAVDRGVSVDRLAVSPEREDRMAPSTAVAHAPPVSSPVTTS